MKFGIATKIGVLLGAFILLGVGLVGWVLSTDSSRALLEQAERDLDAELVQSARGFIRTVDSAVSDLRLLARASDIRDFSQTGILDRQRIEDWLESMLLKQSWYSQVRLLSAEDGKELVRVDRVASGARRTPEDELQKKGSRQYVRDTLAMPPGAVFFSRINLNREFGRISEPLQATLRVAMPIHRSSAGGLVGMLVINVDVGAVFDRISGELSPGMDLLIANSAGEYLEHPDPQKAFAFEFGRSAKLQDDLGIPAETNLLGGALVHVRGEANQDTQDGASIVALMQMPLPSGSAEPFLIVGVSEPLALLEGEASAMLGRAFWVTGLLGVLAAGVALLFAGRLAKPLLQVAHAVEAFRVGGEFRGCLPTGRNDEIGQLARSVLEMDQRIQTQMRWLQEEHGRLDSLIETAADAIVQIDPDGMIERSNSAVTHLFGYTREEMLGQNVSMLMNTPDSERHDTYLREYQRTGEGSIIGVGREVIGRHKDGRLLQLHLAIAEFEMDGQWRYTGILHDISELKAIEEKLRHQANTDSLTGAFNRRYVVEQLQHEVARAERYRTPLSVMLIDLDRFKTINDQLGHATGDEALLRIVALLSEALRTVDVLGRYGGDEFLVLLPETHLDTACVVAERLCNLAKQTALEGHADRYLSLSIGITEFVADSTPAELLKRADEALYMVKQTGRGSFAVYSSKDSEPQEFEVLG